MPRSKIRAEKRPARVRAPSLDHWDDIRFFLAIHRTGSLSAASSALGVTQPTCGRRLSALEDTLGVRLFTRAPAGLRLTAEGAALVTAASQMEDAARSVAIRAAATIAQLDGVVRIAMTEFTTLAFGTRVLAALRERHAGIRVELVLADTSADILSGEADVAIRWRGEGFRPSPADVVAQKLGRIGWCLFGGESYLAKRGVPRDPENLTGHDVVLYPGSPHPAADWLAKATRNASVTLLSANMICNAAAVRQGLGLGFFPKPIMRIEPTLKPLTEPVGFAFAWLVMHPDLQKVPRIRAVADVLAASFQEELRGS